MQVRSATSLIDRRSLIAGLRNLGVMTAIAVLVLSVGCDNGSSGIDPDPDPMEPDPVEPGPFFGLGTTIATPTVRLGLAKAVPSLEGEIGADGGIEVPERLGLFGPEGSGFLWVGAAEVPTIQRYAVADDGSLSADGPRVSFANFGIPRADESRGRVPFLSPTKAYFMPRTGDQIVIWNPQDMTIEGSFDVPLPEREGFRVIIELTPKRVDNLMYVAVAFNDFANARVAELSALLVIDTDTDQVVAVSETERCGQLAWSAVANDGFIYYGSAFFTAAVNRIFGDSNAPASCVLRVRAGDTNFDPDFFVSVEDLTGGQPGAALIGTGDEIYLRAFNEAESGLTITEQTTTGELANAAAWRWWQVSPDFASATELTAVPFGGSQSRSYIVDGRVIVADSTEDFASTSFLELNAAEGVHRLGSSIGQVVEVFRAL